MDHRSRFVKTRRNELETPLLLEAAYAGVRPVDSYDRADSAPVLGLHHTHFSYQEGKNHRHCQDVLRCYHHDHSHDCYYCCYYSDFWYDLCSAAEMIMMEMVPVSVVSAG